LKQVIQQTADPLQAQQVIFQHQQQHQQQQQQQQQEINKTVVHPSIKPVVLLNQATLSQQINARGRGSSQGKYKDIILKDEFGEDIMLKRKPRTSAEEVEPEEKRRKFLERNRWESLFQYGTLKACPTSV